MLRAGPVRRSILLRPRRSIRCRGDLMKQDRREFLTKTGCALGMTALATQMRHFGLMSAVAQRRFEDETANIVAAPSDYRALVCIFLAGGNDGNNMIVPNHNDGTISNYN